MADKPTPTTDLLKRCAEIHEWRSTGVLSGEALRDYAKRKWPGRLDTLQMAEHETVTEALALLAKWGQPDQAADSLQEDAARLDWLDQQCEAYGFQDIHEGNRWEIGGAYANVREAIDAERAAMNKGATHD